MKLEDALQLEEEHYKRRMKLRWKKGHDYAKEDGDILANFKVMADVEKALENHGYRIPIEESYGTAIWHLLHKLVRLLNLFNNKANPQNESLIDTFLDANNYIDLAKECYMDSERVISDK